VDPDAIGPAAAAASLSFWVLALDFLGLALGFPPSVLLRTCACFCVDVDVAVASVAGGGCIMVVTSGGGGGERGRTSAMTSSTSLRFVIG
jgi:hypothetical protein